MKFNEQIIKEKRTIEATKKEYLGPSSRLVVICKYLGEEIIQQGGLETNYIRYDSFWDVAEENSNFIDENTPIYSLGFYFYGLKYSCDLEIYYLENEKRTKVIYKGQKVYDEVNGDLESYCPNIEWENLIEKFFNIAKEKKIKSKNIENIEKKQLFEESKKSVLEKIKSVWGV